MTCIMVDVEADGPCPGQYSMIEIGAVVVDDKLDKTFHGKLCPITSLWEDEALKAIGATREQTLNYPFAESTMFDFYRWLENLKAKKLMFFSDNNGFDWQFVNFYFWRYFNRNPFGHSSTNLGSLYKGLVKDTFKNFKHLRKTKHTHNPVDDAMGNAEALLYMKNQMGLNINLE